MDRTLENELASLNRAWRDAEPWTGGGGAVVVPDDTYVAKLVDMEVGRSKRSGRKQLDSSFEIMSGEFEGEVVHKFNGLETQENFNFLKGYLQVLGMEPPDDLRDLQSECDRFVKSTEGLWDIQLKTQGEYQNVTVLGQSDYVEDRGDDRDLDRERDRGRDRSESQGDRGVEKRQREPEREMDLSGGGGRDRDRGRERERDRGGKEDRGKVSKSGSRSAGPAGRR